MKRICLGVPGESCGLVTEGSRCPRHRAAAQAPYADPTYKRERRVAIAAEPWCHTQPACPYGDAGTPANPLTAHHSVPIAAGGQHSRLVVLCLRCNSALRDRVAELDG